MKYTFLLTAYKRLLLGEAIESILSQTYTDFKLIIVDDASPESLDEIICRYTDNRITHYKHSQNLGGKNLVAHWNNCLGYVDSDYVILASDDDTYEPTFLEEIDRLVSLHPECDVIEARARFVDTAERISVVSPLLKEKLSMTEYAYAFSSEWIISSLQNHVFQLKSLREIGGFIDFPLAWHTDDATVLALSQNGVLISANILFNFNNSGDNISSKPETKETLKLKIRAREDFRTWIKKTYLPMLRGKEANGRDNAYYIHHFEQKIDSKLNKLTLSMLFRSSSSTVWSNRDFISGSNIMTKTELCQFLFRKNWKDRKSIIKSIFRPLLSSK